jgi:hypothetical protein
VNAGMSEEGGLLVGEVGELRLVRNVLLRHMHGGAPVSHNREGVVEYYGRLYVLGMLLFLRYNLKLIRIQEERERIWRKMPLWRIRYRGNHACRLYCRKRDKKEEKNKKRRLTVPIALFLQVLQY